MDIIQAEKLKKYIRMGTGVLRRMLGKCANPEVIHADLKNSGNPIVFAVKFNELGVKLII